MLYIFRNFIKNQCNSIAPYHIINFLFGVIVVSIFVYSALYSAENLPIPALLTDITGETPPSKGLSSSFSEIVRGNFDLALNYNPYGLRIFSFFFLQLLLRVFFSIVVRINFMKINNLVFIDSTLSIALFAWCFSPLIAYTLRMLYSLLQGLS